jgi:hypothetical protein
MLILHMRLDSMEQCIEDLSTYQMFLIELLGTTHKLDQHLFDWLQSLPESWRYSETAIPPTATDVFSPKMHLYPTFFVANDWGLYRALRLFNASLSFRIYENLRRVNPEAEFKNTMMGVEMKIQELVDEVCASIPYHLGYRVMESEIIHYPVECFPNQRHGRLMSACHMMWPLYMAGSAHGISSTQRSWIASKLTYIGEELGARQSVALANRVSQRVSLDAETNQLNFI